MINNKKFKLNKLNFYTINEDYITYLSNFDTHIAYNKNETRPYIGIVLMIGCNYYFAPLFSPKDKHKLYKENLTCFKMHNNKTNSELVIIRFTDMIPVPPHCVSLLNVENKSYGYRRLLSEQYSCINLPKNKIKIMEKASILYKIVSDKNLKTKMAQFYKELSCDFNLLEKKCFDYIQKV